MSNLLNISELEQLQPFLNNERIMEIVIRGKNNRFQAFQKVAFNNLPQSEARELAEKAIGLMGENKFLGQKNLKLIQQVAGMQNLNLILNGLNLVTTVAGFAIMSAEIDKLSKKIKQEFNQLNNIVKQGHEAQATFELNKVLGDYNDMLDSRRRQQPYSEEKMRILVDNIYNVLNLLIESFQRNTGDYNKSLIDSIFSLLSMYTTSLKYFDEQYYFNNRDILADQEVWHSSHDKWMSIFDRLKDDWFIEKLQDYAYFCTKLNTFGVDVFYTELMDQIFELHQEVEDNQDLIKLIDDSMILNTLRKSTSVEIKEAIEEVMEKTFSKEKSPESNEVYSHIMEQVRLL